MSDEANSLQKVCMNPKTQTAFHTLQNILNFTIYVKCGPNSVDHTDDDMFIFQSGSVQQQRILFKQ